MEFTSSNKRKTEIIDRRYKYERKWMGFRWSIRILTICGIILIGMSLLRYISNVGNSAANLLYICMAIPTGILVPFFLKVIARSTLSRWVTDRFAEKLEIRDGVIIRSYSFSLGGGYMNLVEGKDRMILTIKLSDIRDLKLCEKTGRIQFNADTRIVYYSDWHNKVLEQDYVDKNSLNVFYNYFEPDLIKFFKESGIPYIEGDMKFKRGD